MAQDYSIICNVCGEKFPPLYNRDDAGNVVGYSAATIAAAAEAGMELPPPEAKSSGWAGWGLLYSDHCHYREDDVEDDVEEDGEEDDVEEDGEEEDGEEEDEEEEDEG